MTRDERLKLKADEKAKKAREVVVKEMQFGLKIADNDFQIKLARIKDFLGKNNRVKVTVKLQGREMAYPEMAIKLIDKIVGELSAVSRVEQEVKTLGRSYIMILRPLSRKERGGV